MLTCGDETMFICLQYKFNNQLKINTMKTLTTPPETAVYNYSLEQIRDVYKFCSDSSIDFREYLEEINGDLVKHNTFVLSYNDSLLTFGELQSDEYIKDSGLFYSSNDYVNTREGNIILQDDAYFCERYEEYCEETFTVYRNRSESQYCQDAIDRGDFYFYQGEYYDYDALSNNDLCICDDEVRRQEDLYYWESDNEYHTEPEEDERRNNEFTNDYHSGGISKPIVFSKKPQFYIGYEIEKEDEEIKESISIGEFMDTLPNWRKERDGSLDDIKGFELISPIFELKTNRIFEIIKSNDILIKHINADKSDSCGGHINISEQGLTGAELFAKIKGYTPLFHALYYKRINKTYSKGKSNKDLIDSNEKYQSIKIHDNRLEYRIISAVKNVEQLKWRTELMAIILKHPTACPKIAYFNCQTLLKKHLKKEYKNERFEILNERIIKYTLEKEGIVIAK